MLAFLFLSILVAASDVPAYLLVVTVCIPMKCPLGFDNPRRSSACRRT